MEIITREEFIYDFMLKTQRPASELREFLEAFEGKRKSREVGTVDTSNKRVIRSTSPLTKAKFVEVYMDENDKKTFASQYAAADFLGVTQSTVSYAISKGSKIKGYNIRQVKIPFTNEH